MSTEFRPRHFNDFAARALSRRTVSDDVLQDALLDLLTDPDFDPDRPGAEAYLVQKLRWRRASLCRQRRHAHLLHSHDREGRELPPDEAAILNEERARLHAAIASLPDRQREAILARLAGTSVKETAASMVLCPGAVYRLLYQAYGALRNALT
jgi:RNA polymerase sigma factor (sigma-70 family)